MSRKRDLEVNIVDSYRIISEYEAITRETDRPEERNRAARNIDKQWNLIRTYVDEYVMLCRHLKSSMGDNIAEIMAHFPEYRRPVVPPEAESNHAIARDLNSESNSSVGKGGTTSSTMDGHIASKREYDVFLCHNSIDKGEVKKIGNQLKERGVSVWLDEWELPPGRPWLRLVEQQITSIKSAAVFIGRESMGPWQRQELDALLREFVDRGCPVIPVLLPNAHAKPELPVFLRGMKWVDFGVQDPNPMEQLIWGIRGVASLGDKQYEPDDR